MCISPRFVNTCPASLSATLPDQPTIPTVPNFAALKGSKSPSCPISNFVRANTLTAAERRVSNSEMKVEIWSSVAPVAVAMRVIRSGLRGRRELEKRAKSEREGRTYLSVSVSVSVTVSVSVSVALALALALSLSLSLS
eukprot:4195141-Pleurochrysis_carterae.AAC.1